MTMEDSINEVIVEMLYNINKEMINIKKQINEISKSTKTWITLQEASKRVSLSKPTLLKLINNGDITAKRLSGKWLINVNSLEDYLSGDKINIENFISSVV